MNLIRAALTGVTLGILASCCTLNIKERKFVPEYRGVDPKAAPFVEEYLKLAQERGIVFTHAVTVGFKDLKKGAVIGETYYGIGFREITLDNVYWNEASYTSRMILVFHELSHAYCERDHDWEGGRYENSSSNTGMHKDPGFPIKLDFLEGRFEDSCPRSIMFPSIISDDCTRRHFSEYINEMFDRCNKY